MVLRWDMECAASPTAALLRRSVQQILRSTKEQSFDQNAIRGDQASRAASGSLDKAKPYDIYINGYRSF
jgi:hypothetical protein